MSAELLTLLDEYGCVACESTAFAELLGTRPEDLTGRPFRELLHDDDQMIFARVLSEALRRPRVELTRPLRVRTLEDRFVLVHSTISNFLDEPDVQGIVVTSHNVTEDLLAQVCLDPLVDPESASGDGLGSGLSSRLEFVYELERSIGGLAATGDALAVMCISLEGYETSEDEEVHELNGDVLRAATAALHDAVGADELVSLIGEHELGVLIRPAGDEYAKSLLRRIPDYLHRSLDTELGPVSLRSTIGLAETSDHLEPVSELIRRAEGRPLPELLPPGPAPCATQTAPAAEPAPVAASAPAPKPEPQPQPVTVTVSVTAEPELRLGDLIAEVLAADSVCLVDVVPDNGALARGEMSLRYLPVYDLSTGGIAALQVVPRWIPAVEGVSGPVDVFSSTDMSRNTVAIGRWVLRTAAKAIEQLQREAEVFGLRLMFQVFRRQLDGFDLLEHVREALDPSDLEPSQFVFEIAESILTGSESPGGERELLKGLKELGTQLSVSDYRSGYTSLDYLTRLRVDELTVACLPLPNVAGEDPESREFLQRIVRLADAAGVRVVVEGVDNPVQLMHVRESGCRFAQGRLFSDPLDVTALQQLMQRTPRFSPVVRNFAMQRRVMAADS